MIDKSNAEKLILWLNENIDKISFGEISVKFIIHDRQVKRIEKTLVEREQEREKD